MINNILLVDDDIMLINSLEAYLTSEGFMVSTVSTAREALKVIQERMPDLIVADIMMPDVDGYDLVRMLRLDDFMRAVPIILLTAKGMTDDRIKGYDLGCSAYLAKPFNPRELVSIINNLLSNREIVDKRIVSTLQPESDLLVKAQRIIGDLTHRELTILKLVVKGFMNKEIAANLNVSTRSVEKYVSRLLSKTSTRNRTELAQFIIGNKVSLIEGE
uniref:hypothetical protein Ycf29 n=1 Tax=Gloiopeltis furcata TaxID=42017 RepID=UPI0028D2ABA2|nr:hypothetical protein Ycf29 [Gloiopeltis furcata]WMP13971.1 hypothetical protein Ycf29 [Gloiopeltis furcata]